MDRKVGLPSKDQQQDHLRGLVRASEHVTYRADSGLSIRQMGSLMGHMFAAASYINEHHLRRETPGVRGASRFLAAVGESIGGLDERAGQAVTRLGRALVSEVSQEVLRENYSGFVASEVDVRFYRRLGDEPTSEISERDRWRLLYTSSRTFGDELNEPVPTEGTVFGSLLTVDPDELDDRSRLALTIRDECVGLAINFDGLYQKEEDPDEAGSILGSINRLVALGVTPIMHTEEQERVRETVEPSDPLEVAQRVAGMWLGEFLGGAEVEDRREVQVFPEAAPPSDFVSENYFYADRWPQIGALMSDTHELLETRLDIFNI